MRRMNAMLVVPYDVDLGNGSRRMANDSAHIDVALKARKITIAAAATCRMRLSGETIWAPASTEKPRIPRIRATRPRTWSTASTREEGRGFRGLSGMEG